MRQEHGDNHDESEFEDRKGKQCGSSAVGIGARLFFSTTGFLQPLLLGPLLLRNMTKRHCRISVHFSFISSAHKSPLAVLSCDQAHIKISGIKIREFDTPD
jgi:hypothetical protein